VLNEVTNKGIGNVKVQLIDASGDIAQTVRTNARGNYRFKVKNEGAFVVREVTPKKYVQVTPSFSKVAPTGALISGAGATSWNYVTGNNNPANGPVGPSSWQAIAPEGAAPFESPINIQGPATDLSSVLTINYPNTTPTKVINNGHQLQAQFPATTTDTIAVAGQSFSLSQFHYHDPSENQVNGTTYPMEEHFVNVSASGAETVVAVFLQLGAHNSALQPILDAASAHLTKSGASTTLAAPINFSGLLPSSLMGWFYEGSLTTPPLSQAVNWFVMATPITLDYGQLSQYEAVASGSGFLPNARPIQPLDGRQVNQNNFDVTFAGTSVGGLNFGLQSATSTQSVHPSSVSAKSTEASGVALVSAQSTASPNATTSTGQTPTAGGLCNCPICQALRNGTFHQVNIASFLAGAAPAGTTISG
jgi:carbonic anhydrase